MTAQIIPISDSSLPLATSVGPNDLLLIDQVDGTQITGYKTKRVKGSLVGTVVNVQTYGADPTGANDSSAALTTAFASLVSFSGIAGGGTIYFPTGFYKFSSAVTLTLPASFFRLSIVGPGAPAATLWWPNAAGGIIIDTSAGGPFNSVKVEGVSFITGIASGGTALTIIQTTLNVDGAIDIPSAIRDVAFYGADGLSQTFYWTTCIQITNVSNVNFDGVFCQGPGSTNGTGISVDGSVANSDLGAVYNFINCICNSQSVGFRYGNWIQGVSISNCNLTACTTCISAPASETGFLDQLLITNSQFAPIGSGQGISILTEVDNIGILNNLFILNGTTSVIAINAALYGQISVNGNNFIAPGGGIGVQLGTGDSNGCATVQGNTFVNFTNPIKLLSGSKGCHISGNAFKAVTGTTIVNSSTDATNVIRDNIGYNPVGAAAVTTSASPYTYTAGPSPETLYISASTSITNVTQGGVGILPVASGAAALFTIQLGPNEPVVITYTGTLTAKKMIH